MLNENIKRMVYALSLTTAFITFPAYAESSKPTLDTVLVIADEAPGGGTKTVPSNAAAKETIQKTPGGVAVVEAKDYEDKYSLNLEDTLNMTPGVYAQKRFGEEVRVSVRGSGLSRGFHMRGLTLLQDGVPFNLADGSADFQEADSLAFQRLEVFKGGNSLQLGGTTLGGALNMVSKTAQSQPGSQVRLEGGSYSTFRTNLQSGYVFDQSDVFVSLTGTTSEGYREHDDQKNIKFNGNYGVNLSDTVETRFYLSGNVIDQELPGSISRFNALNNPKKADPSSITTDWHRDMNSVRLSNKTSIDIGDDNVLDVGGFVNIKDLFHPITPFVGIIDQESADYGIFAQGSGEYDFSGHRNTYRIGVTSHFGEVDAKVFQNIAGSRGNLTADADQESKNAMLYAENHFYFLPQWALVTAGQLTWSERDLTDNITPTESDSEKYKSFNPKIGILYEPTDTVQVFANISKSHETPTFSELTQSGTSGFTPVRAQKAWTAEIGTRGIYDRFAWDASLYRAWINDEMLQFTTGPSIPAATFNADDTIHQGLELGFDINLANGLFTDDDMLGWRNAYTFSDYYFDNDQQYGDNEIAGQPRHFYQTELRYDHASRWYAALNWEVSDEADVDFSNTVESPGYGIIGVHAGYDLNESVHLYIDGRNLLDHDYISTFSTTVNGAGNVYYPGEGRQVYTGMRIRF